MNQKLQDRNRERNSIAHKNPVPIYSIRTQKQIGVKITDPETGATVPHSIYITTQMLKKKFKNNLKKAFYTVRNMQRSGMLPRMGSEAKPLKKRDFELYNRNMKLGKQKWKWIQSTAPGVRTSTGYDSVWGYGYHTKNGFVIVNKNNKPEFTVQYE